MSFHFLFYKTLITTLPEVIKFSMCYPIITCKHSFPLLVSAKKAVQGSTGECQVFDNEISLLSVFVYFYFRLSVGQGLAVIGNRMVFYILADDRKSSYATHRGGQNWQCRLFTQTSNVPSNLFWFPPSDLNTIVINDSCIGKFQLATSAHLSRPCHWQE